MSIDGYSGVISIGYGGKLMVGPNYICGEPGEIPADVVIAISNKDECPKIDKRHFHFQVKNVNNSNSRYNYKAATEQVRDSLSLGKRVLIHAPDTRKITVAAGALYLIKAYPSFEDALWNCVNKSSSGKPPKELIEMAQAVLYDNK